MTPIYPGCRNILVIQLGDIGDVVLATPAFRAVRESYPSARLTALVRKGYGSLLQADPNITEVIEVAKKRGKLAEMGRASLELFRRLRQAGYDLVIDLRTGDRGAILAFFTGAPVRAAVYNSDRPFWRNRIFNHPIYKTEHAPPPTHPGADQSLRILRAIGIDTENTTPKLWIPKAAAERVRLLLAAENLEEESRWVTVNPFSRWKYKEWGYGKWVEVIDWLYDRHGLRSILVGSRDEADAAAALAANCNGYALNFAGKTTLVELAALIGRSSLHLGVDSAAPHIAAAVGTPAVTIFGPSDWRAWMVPDPTHRVVAPDMECVPCSRKGCDHREKSICLDEMGADRMKDAIGEVLKALREQVPGREMKSS